MFHPDGKLFAFSFLFVTLGIRTTEDKKIIKKYLVIVIITTVCNLYCPGNLEKSENLTSFRKKSGKLE